MATDGDEPLSIDYRLFRVLNNLVATHHWWNGLVKDWAEYSAYVFPAALVLLWIFPGRADSHRVRTAAVIAALAALLALGLDQILNHIVNRPRPYVGHPVHLLLPKSLDNSFPSDHTAFAFAIVAGIWPVRRKIAIALGVVGVGLALARVIAGLHYPGDVLGGAAVGVVSAVIVWFVARKPIGWITALGERVYDFVTRPVRRLAPRRT